MKVYIDDIDFKYAEITTDYVSGIIEKRLEYISVSYSMLIGENQLKGTTEIHPDALGTIDFNGLDQEIANKLKCKLEE